MPSPTDNLTAMKAGRCLDDEPSSLQDLHQGLSITNALPYMIWIMRPDLVLSFVNDTCKSFVGLDVDEINVQGWKSLIHRDDLPTMLVRIADPLQLGEPHEVEYRLKRSDGEYRWVHSHAHPLRDGAGVVTRWIGTTQDIHDRRIVELQLRDSEARFRQLADAVPQIVWVTDGAGGNEFHNQRWFEYTQLSRSFAHVDDWMKVVHPDDAAALAANWSKSLAAGEAFEQEFRLRRLQSEEYRWFLARAMPIRDFDGKVTRWFGTSTDIDDQKRAAARLEASERIYRAIGESIDFGVWVCAPDGRNTYASPSFLKLVGLTQEECSEFGWGRILHPDDSARTIEAWKRCVAEEGRWDVEHRCRGVDGRWHPILARGVPVRDGGGNITCWAGINLDISNLKEAETSLRELNASLEQRVRERTAAAEERAKALAISENELRRQSLIMHSILNSMAEGVVVSDRNGDIVLLNRAASDLHGRGPSKDRGADWSQAYGLYTVDTGEPFPKQQLPLVQALQGQSSDDVEMIVRSPAHANDVIINVKGRPLYSGDGDLQGGVVVFRDVTARQQMLEELRDSEERFRSAFDFAAVGMCLVSLEGGLLRVNHSLSELLGYTEQELLTTTLQEIVDTDGRAAVIQGIDGLIAGSVRVCQLEKRFRHKLGHCVDVLLAMSLVQDSAAAPCYFVAQLYDLTHQKAAEMARRQSLLRTRFVEQSLAAREDEQRRIARDLHDGIGQSLTSIRLGLRVIEEATDLASVQAAVREIRTMVATAYDEVRSLTRSLRPQVLDDMGLIPALGKLVEEISSSHRMTIKLATDSVEGERFSDAVETALYRIVQEGLTNVVKHADADVVEISLTDESGEILLVVADDGVGIQSRDTSDTSHRYGIAGMRERATLLGGSFELTQKHTGGAVLRVRIPKK